MFSESGSSSSSSSSRSGWTYDVFLSFRGEDTRKNFTDHLYTALVQAGIHTFRDDDALPRGQEISPQLRQAIQKSRISIVVFSKGYASSRWCLNELEEILDSKRMNTNQIVLPIFYDIDPSDVRKQTGSFKKAFDGHKKRFKEKVKNWREALLKAGNLSGWNLKDMADGHESKFIQKIIEDLLKQLGHELLNIAKYPVGIDYRVDGVIDLLSNGANDVCIVGIYGMPGVGKTTVAKAVFNQLCYRYEGCCFLFDVKEKSNKDNGLVQLQEQLLCDILKTNVLRICDEHRGVNLIKERLCRKRALVVVDDVDQQKQLDALVGDKSWFGPGSIILITTRNERLLNQFEMCKKFKVEGLNQDESLQLFSWHAFRNTHPSEAYLEHSCGVVKYCGGLPLALEVLGSSLFKTSEDEWESAIVKLRKIPDSRIHEKLRLSFDTLDRDVKRAFLDISCFFIGGCREYVAKILHGRCGYEPEINIVTLIERSLLTIDRKNTLRMHDLLRDMGREIVSQRSPQDPGGRSRIWLHNDALDVLKNEMGTKTVQGLMLDVRKPGVVSFNTKAFKDMSHLQLLQINGVKLIGSYEHLSKKLIWLCWLECPLKSLPSNFQLDNISVLDMQYSNLKELWKETKSLNKLKILNLSHSKYLAKLPNFQEFFDLERLILEDCPSLIEVHQSIGHLRKLVFLNLKGCCELRNLPESICSLKCLEILNLNMCSRFEKLPDRLGDMESLIVLLADATAITQLPSSIGNLKNLINLSLSGCNNVLDFPSSSWLSLLPALVSPKSSSSKALLPTSFLGLTSLRELNLSFCNLSESEMSSADLGSLHSLQYLDLSGNEFSNLPPGIGRLAKLQKFLVNKCNNLLSISDIPSGLYDVEACDCSSMQMVSFPPKIRPVLSARGCKNLAEIRGIEAAANNWDFKMAEGNNLSKKSMKILVQACGDDYDIVVVGGEIPEWFSHRGEGSSVPFQIPNTISNGIIQALAVWTVCAGYEDQRDSLYTGLEASIKNKTRGNRLLERKVGATFNRSYNKYSWVCHMTLAGLSFEMDRGDELELYVNIRSATKIKVERCGVHLIVKQPDAAADGESQSVSALGCTEARWKSSLTRELQQCSQICSSNNNCNQIYIIGHDFYYWTRRDGESNDSHRVKITLCQFASALERGMEEHGITSDPSETPSLPSTAVQGEPLFDLIRPHFLNFFSMLILILAILYIFLFPSKPSI